MNYQCKQGETFVDFVLNSCGDIAAWSDCLNTNFQNSWTPNVYSGLIFKIPDNTSTNIGNIAELNLYPANNFSIPDLNSQIDSIFALLETATPIATENTTLPPIDTNTYFIVTPLSTIGDVVMNSTGNIQNWGSILDANSFNDWTPTLYAGQKIAIPSTATLNLNNFRALNTYPANNNSVPDIYEQINAIFDLLNNSDPWILATSFWRDQGIWVDSARWID